MGTDFRILGNERIIKGEDCCSAGLQNLAIRHGVDVVLLQDESNPLAIPELLSSALLLFDGVKHFFLCPVEGRVGSRAPEPLCLIQDFSILDTRFGPFWAHNFRVIRTRHYCLYVLSKRARHDVCNERWV